MKRLNKNLILSLFFVFTTSQGLLPLSNSSAVAAEASGQPANFALRKFDEETLPNGLRVLFIHDQSLPKINLSLLIRAGSLFDPAGNEGINYLTANLLEQGTPKMSAMKVAEELGQIASDLIISPGADYTTVAASTLASEKNKLLSIFSDSVMNSAFESKEVERMRAEQFATIQRASDQASSFADRLTYQKTFKKHPYSNPSYGNENSLKIITRTMILKHYFRYYRPNNSILAITGQFDESFKKSVRQTMGKWQKRDLEKYEDHSIQREDNSEMTLFAKPGLQQTQIRFAHIGIKRTHPDFMALRLANVVLGGGFTSRLNQRVRDDLGLTYSIASHSDARLENGLFEISTFTRNEKVFETIKETKKVLKDFVEDGVTEDELEAAKTLMKGQFPAAIETTDKLALNLMLLRFFGVDDTYLSNYSENLNKITKKEVNEAIRNNIKIEKMNIVIYADQQKVIDQLKALGEVKVEAVTVQAAQ